MKRKLALALALLMLTGCGKKTGPAAENTAAPSPSQTVSTPAPTPTPEPTPTPVPDPTVATLAVCGDVMTHMPVTNAAKQPDGSYDFLPIMEAARPIVSSADYAVANLETTFAGGQPSGYPAFNAPDALADGLIQMGFDLMMTCNNHSLDKGFSGLCRTLDVLDEKGMPHVGTARTQEEFDNDVVLADVGGISVAFVAFTYGTNGIPLPSGAPYAVSLFNTDYATSMSHLDEEYVLRRLGQAKALDPDLVCVMIHWGVEYQTKENAYQDKVAQFLFDNGADLILGGHPHVLQPMELRAITRNGAEKQGFVCYSLGNFISNQYFDETYITAVLEVELTRDNVTGITEVSDFRYTPMLMQNPLTDGNAPSLVLLDAYTELAKDQPAWRQNLLNKAVSVCHSILGEDRDARVMAEAASSPAA